VRTKQNVVLQRRYSRPVDKSAGVRSDQTVILTAIGSAKTYPDEVSSLSVCCCTRRPNYCISRPTL
jgi:hypothetical protein